ncbi:polysaccharide pyruvyl transferase family protein [Priestia megaterium]|uniref:polysaccharide pyruvyl transferase family protein n=1 Tax=Priestia megaterium TaxID=1404 RepID=UPI000D518071|nr:polysaccharide pyruvyl transferase family protein [Priestia megaterium]PVE74491.1 polysaccharide pyruvyl transferase family protein [Priestia megaterium]PVE82426.1 polysaccharide pyruvyl transferase family protein [Priestia megaterium]PVE87012.1 polysaccharide pyruvyl transferase family protein [Priestia megaterium]PVE94543.1 polysaccharide pyruvyl transferase family protein [Priestia megaterium]
MKKVLYIGWIGFGNLGDELLWHVFKELSEKYYSKEEIEVTPSFPGVDFKNVEPYDTVVLGGGSLLLPGYLQVLQKAADLGKDILIWGSGMDWVEKEQLNKMLAGENISLRTLFTEKDGELMKDVFNRVSFAGIRGPLAKKALEAIGVDSEKIRIIGDPGLLLSANSIGGKKEKIIGVNWGTTYNRLYGGNELAVEDALANACKKLIQQGYKIAIYLVWGSDKASCQRLFDKINDPEHVVFDEKLHKEQELMTILSCYTMTINFKLHANILSLAAGVPCVALGYRFKVFDLVSSLELEQCVVSTDSNSLEQDILTTIAYIEGDESSIIEKYKAREALYRPMLTEPFIKKLI